MGKVVHFEFATPDPAKEIEFFTNVFGWKIESWGDEQYWLVNAGEPDAMGINGAIHPSNPNTDQRVVDTIAVDDLDESIAKAVSAGATVSMGRQEVPGIGWTAVLTTPTGIVIGLLEPLPREGM
jgi:predicted enzyme related to lactoylglutathione lyase